MIEKIYIPDEWEIVLEKENKIGKVHILINKTQEDISIIYLWNSKDSKSEVNIYEGVNRDKFSKKLDSIQDREYPSIDDKPDHSIRSETKREVVKFTRNYLHKEGIFKDN